MFTIIAYVLFGVFGGAYTGAKLGMHVVKSSYQDRGGFYFLIAASAFLWPILVPSIFLARLAIRLADKG